MATRFVDRKVPRIAVGDEYMKKAGKERRSAEAAAAKEGRSRARSTWATGPQFLLFAESENDNPGPGEYSPTKIQDFRTGNVKLGHKMAVKGGRGAEGEAVGDDDSVQNQSELVGRVLVDDTGDRKIDGAMKAYRKKIEREVRGGQLAEAPTEAELERTDKRLFFGMPTPGFPVDRSHERTKGEERGRGKRGGGKMSKTM